MGRKTPSKRRDDLFLLCPCAVPDSSRSKVTLIRPLHLGPVEKYGDTTVNISICSNPLHNGSLTSSSEAIRRLSSHPAETGIQDPQIFTGPGTGGCGPGNNKTQPFTYRMTVNTTGRYTYNDGCNPETTLGILWVLPRRKISLTSQSFTTQIFVVIRFTTADLFVPRCICCACLLYYLSSLNRFNTVSRGPLSAAPT